MDASTMGDGRIPVPQTLGRSLSSMLSIVSGGSIGREGSMVQLAAMGASVLGQWLRMPTDRLRLLVACGVAAGLTGAYNAPFASTFFVAEIVLGSIALDSLGPIMVAAVVTNISMREFPGYQPPYVIPGFPAIQGLEVLLFAMLGILSGLASALFLRGLEASRKLFSSLPIVLPLRLGLGGLVVGLVSWFWPEVWGNGYSVVNEALHSQWSWSLLLPKKIPRQQVAMAQTFRHVDRSDNVATPARHIDGRDSLQLEGLDFVGKFKRWMVDIQAYLGTLHQIRTMVLRVANPHHFQDQIAFDYVGNLVQDTHVKTHDFIDNLQWLVKVALAFQRLAGQFLAQRTQMV